VVDDTNLQPRRPVGVRGYFDLDVATAVLERVEACLDDGESHLGQGIMRKSGLEAERLDGMPGLELHVGAMR
jgi:hypothetical protein